MGADGHITRKVYLTFPKNKVPEALLWRASQLGVDEALADAIEILRADGDACRKKALTVLESISQRHVVTNVRGASVSDEIGIMAVELSGTASDIERAMTYLADNGVTVEPIEKNVIE